LTDPTKNYDFLACHAVAYIRSPFKEKFAVPRQPGLVTAAKQQIVLTAECNREEILRGLDGFSHLWLIFVFHQVQEHGWTPTVRPPRLGGNQRLGVFATRSPFRPNPLGLSVVKIEAVEKEGKQWIIEVSGGDLVDGTPILDIKPYVPYVDAIPDAAGGFTDSDLFTEVTVTFSPEAESQISALESRYPELRLLIEQVLSQQPQPAYHGKDRNKSYGMALYDLNIRWQIEATGFKVVAVEPLKTV
jgi:putative methyltransferase, YaeB/AF_0241 family